MVATEYTFALPLGLAGADGAVHREGTMRLATALDEIEPLADPLVLGNEGYLAVLLLARVVTSLGPHAGDAITPALIASLYARDFDHLQQVYEHVNGFAA